MLLNILQHSLAAHDEELLDSNVNSVKGEKLCSGVSLKLKVGDLLVYMKSFYWLPLTFLKME